ncbi:hypothetical protein AVEN_219744-1 [Araneus ventricosus]|uniref:Uncharacterized protein n=1 Tax=Araneus ventricosus TaxID=182803 RepID=A0A4Y2BAJ3_ARAVE|nr:hypothetical protein AVEN_114194-1 [Araneus ventricosus]GBL88124.1 hypothetical protein AVEN_219744-1 [Araneus ventricosus]
MVHQFIETGIKEIWVQVSETLNSVFLEFSIGSEMATCQSSARPSPRVLSRTENDEPAQDFQRGSSSPAPYMRADGYRRTIHAGYNGMAFTPWVTLPGEKNSRRTSLPHFTQGHHPRHDEAE